MASAGGLLGIRIPLCRTQAITSINDECTPLVRSSSLQQLRDLSKIRYTNNSTSFGQDGQ